MPDPSISTDAPDAHVTSTRMKYGRCPFCGRECALTFHHLIPRKLHRRVYFKKTFSREELRRGIAICRLCHDGIHDLYDEMALAKVFHSPGRLSADARLRRHFRWVAKQQGGQGG